MEPHREEQPRALEPSAKPKPRRFRIVKLEERIAPTKGGHGTHNGCGATAAGCATQIGGCPTGDCVTTTALCDPAY